MAKIITGDDGDNFYDLSLLGESAVASLLGGADTVVGTRFNDTLDGGDGDDTFIVNGMAQGADRVTGGAGFDRILGTDGDDAIGLFNLTVASSIELIDGGAGTNVIRGDAAGNTLDFSATTLLNVGRIEGLGGADVIVGSSGADVIVGGAGNDRLSGGPGDDVFISEGGAEGVDVVSGGGGYDRILGGAGDDVFQFSNFSGDNTVEEIDGGAGDNVIRGDAAGNTLNFAATLLLEVARIEGLGGNDIITGSAAGDVIAGGAGNDRLAGGPGDDVFVVQGAGEGVDVVSGGAGYDRVLGGGGDDVFQFSNFSGDNTVEEIDGGAGIDQIRGDAGGNTLDFGAATLRNIARIDGLGGNDVITATPGADLIVGGAGNDRLYGGSGDDTFLVEGGAQGVDQIAGGAGYDRIVGGAGDDVFQLSNFSGDNTVEAIEGGAGLNLVRGDATNNTINFAATVLSQVARIEGLAGNDTITGTAAADVIAGGAGNDVIDGGSGDDVAVFSGRRAGYAVTVGASSVSVGDIDVLDGSEGTDTLRNIERLLFADGEVRLFEPNNAPVAAPDAFSTLEDQTRTILRSELLANDSDADGDPLTISMVGGASNGSVALDASGNIRFTPNANFNGVASFQYTVADGRSGFATGNVSVEVTPVNDAPLAGNDMVVVPIGVPFTIPVGGLLGNDRDIEGDPLSVSGVSNATGGSVVLSGSEIVFTPDSDLVRYASFDYTLEDGRGGSDTGTVNLRMDTGLPPFRVVAVALGGQSVMQWDGLTGQYLGDLVPRGSLINPQAVNVGPDGNLYVVYNGNKTVEPSVHRYAPDGTYLGEYASLAGRSAFVADWHTAIEFDNDGYMYVLDRGSGYGQGEVFRFQRLGAPDEGAFLDTFLTPATIDRPERRLVSYDMETGPDGNLFIASVGSHDILRFKTAGGTDFGHYGEIFIGSGTVSPTNPLNYANLTPNNNGWSFDDYFGVRPFGMDWDENGHLFVAADMIEPEFTTLRVIEIDGAGNYLRDLVPLSEGYPSAGTQNTFGEADFGPDGNFYIASTYSSEILIYGDPSGPNAGDLIARLSTPSFVSGLESIAFIVDGPGGGAIV